MRRSHRIVATIASLGRYQCAIAGLTSAKIEGMVSQQSCHGARSVGLILQNIDVTVAGEAHLSNVSAGFAPGIFNVLLGPTLAGKTTLLRVMAGLDAPTKGAVQLNGTNVTGLPVKKRSVAFVYQQFINYPSLTVFDNIASPLRVAGVPRPDIAERVGAMADLLAIKPLLNRKPLELSGGQQQRVALARALVKEADLVLLDEPLANLDYKLREELRTELPKLFEASGSIVVYATTEPEEALLLGGNITLLHEGRVVESGPTLDVYRNPASVQAAQTFSDPPLNTVMASRTGASMQLAGLAAGFEAPAGLTDGGYRVGFRPHQLYVTEPGPGALAVPAKVAVTEITGSESFIHVDALGERWTALTHGVHHYDAGDDITLYIDPADCLYFDDAGRRVAVR